MAEPNTARRWTSWVGRHLYEEITDEEKSKLSNLRESCKDILDDDTTDLFLLRFCRAREFRMDAVEELLRKATRYGKDRKMNFDAFKLEFQCDAEAGIYPQPEVIFTYFPMHPWGEDKDGSPNV
eukprot:m.111495 g.111495  ORF g.111495 m.111495 type:complete len:124 (-) comp28124_c1_seq2:848-1219(-)